jgi:hypothetical protein
MNLRGSGKRRRSAEKPSISATTSNGNQLEQESRQLKRRSIRHTQNEDQPSISKKSKLDSNGENLIRNGVLEDNECEENEDEELEDEDEGESKNEFEATIEKLPPDEIRQVLTGEYHTVRENFECQVKTLGQVVYSIILKKIFKFITIFRNYSRNRLFPAVIQQFLMEIQKMDKLNLAWKNITQ